MKLIIQHLDQADLETTKSLAAAQIANAVHKITSIINSNSEQDLAIRKVVIDSEAKCYSTSAGVTPLHCNLNILIHK